MIRPKSSPAMFANRIRRFLMDDYDQPQEMPAEQAESAFVPLPAFAAAPAGQAAPLDIYRIAYEQARRQVAARREREQRIHEWN